MVINKIVWDKEAIQQFVKIIAFIKKDSIQNAEHVQLLLQQKLAELPKHPQKYPPDKYKLNNDGRFRAFTLFHYRISYYIAKQEIIILSIRHTKMLPKQY